MSIKIHHDKDTDDHYLDLADVLSDTDTSVSDVKHYTLTVDKGTGVITLVLLDKNKKRLLIKKVE